MNEFLKDFLASAGNILADGVAEVKDAIAIVDLIKDVLGKDTPTDADWQTLHDYEAKQTAILDAPMDGET